MSTQTTITETKLPQWLVDAYTKGITMAGNSVGGGYQRYTAGPRIADFSPQQKQAYGMVSQNVGNYKPYTAAAGNYINSGTQSFAAPGVANQYMNPYTQSVVAGIGSAAGRNLYENILPQVNRTFVGGGTFGGSRSAEFTARAVRDANAAALAEQNKALNTAYENAQGQFNTEANRYLTAAERAQSLGQGVQGMAGVDAAALEAAGRQQETKDQASLDLMRSDWEAQRDYDYNEAAKYLDLVGRPSASGTGTEVKTGPGANKTASTIGTIAGAVGTIADIFGKKDGGPIKKSVPKMGIGWLKDVR
jgi:hypothetical protein